MGSPLKGAIKGVDESTSSTKTTTKTTSSISKTEIQSQKPNIIVAGIGGGGNNTINRIATKGIKKVDMAAINTDKAHLKQVKSDKKIPIGEEITQGRGTGGSPKVGKRAAENSIDKFRDIFRGSDIVFLACGLGGGTGTGGAPVAARVAKEEGAVVTGVVTMPFKVEKRDEIAKKGLEKLRKHADSVMIIDNNKLSDMASGLPMRYAFTMADEVLTRTLKGITETIMVPSLINLDFADVKAIMKEGNIILVGTGEASGENRAEKAARQALSCPLLGNIDYSTAEGVLMHISGADVKLSEADKVGKIVKENFNSEAQIIPGARIDRGLEDTLQTILLISGASSPLILGPASESGENSLGEPSRKEAGSPLNLDLGHL